MGLFSKTIEGNGWSFDKQTGKLTISGELGDVFNPFKGFAKKVLSVEALPGARTSECFYLFSEMENLREADLAELDVSECTDMTYAFHNCSSLTRICLSKWNTSKAEKMSSVFSGCRSLKEADLSSWDVSNVKDFSLMFLFCYALETIDLTGWEISGNADADTLFDSVPKTAHIFTDDVSVVRLLPEGVKPEPHGTIVTRFNTALALDKAGDYEEAARQYRLAAEQGSSAAAFNLAIKHLRGEGVAKDEAEADRWFLRAAELGDTDAMYFVATAFYGGDRSWAKDDKQALYWAQKVKENGDLSETLADKKKVDVLIRKIENNIAFEAAFAASKAGDYEEAAKQYRISAEKGSSTAAWNLGILYGKGQGVPKSSAESFQWRRRAAEMGHARAMYYLAEKYHAGKGIVEQDDEQALAWANKAKETGKLPPEKPVDDLIAEIEKSLEEDPFNEGKHWLSNGDPAAAVHYFKIAAEQGNVSAAWTLGSIYTEGEYRQKDDTEAFRWFMKAAELGHARSMYTIAESYYTGSGGVQKDCEQALTWAKKAKETGEVPADLPVDRLISRIETDIIVQKAADEGYSEEAVHSLVLLAENGSSAAALQLAKIYLNGEGVVQDRNLALHYYATASESGDTEASSFLLGQDIGTLFQDAADAYDRGDRTGALYAFHAAFRTNEIMDRHGLYPMLLDNDLTYIRKLVQISAELFAVEGNKGTPWADYYLGQLYWESVYFHRNGNIPEEPCSAIPFYEKAMDAGFDQALEFMAVRTYLGDCPAVAQNRERAAALLLRAARSEDPDVRYAAAFRYMTGYPEKRNDGETVYVGIEPDKAIELMSALADAGHAGAMYEMVHMYDPENTQYPNDPDKRLEYAKRAAELGHRTAIRFLDYIEECVAEEKQKAFVEKCIRKGNAYYYGTDGHKQDLLSAIDYYEEAAEYDADTALKLGDILYRELGNDEDKQEAIKWFIHAAELGNTIAQRNAGEMYYFGDGVPLDYEEAAKWYTKAANNGDATAQFNLGVMYKLGQGVSQSRAKAERWFEKAGEQNRAEAWLELGIMHYNDTVDVNPTSDYFKRHDAFAREYFGNAAKLGNEEAKRYLRNM